MDNKFELGLAKRKETLGSKYVEENLALADKLTRPFQEAMTEWCWGFGWGDEVIDKKTRSMMNLAMLGALGKMHEWEIHCNGAIKNGAIGANGTIGTTRLSPIKLHCINAFDGLCASTILDRILVITIYEDASKAYDAMSVGCKHTIMYKTL